MEAEQGSTAGGVEHARPTLDRPIPCQSQLVQIQPIGRDAGVGLVEDWIAGSREPSCLFVAEVRLGRRQARPVGLSLETAWSDRHQVVGYGARPDSWSDGQLSPEGFGQALPGKPTLTTWTNLDDLEKWVLQVLRRLPSRSAPTTLRAGLSAVHRHPRSPGLIVRVRLRHPPNGFTAERSDLQQIRQVSGRRSTALIHR